VRSRSTITTFVMLNVHMGMHMSNGRHSIRGMKDFERRGADHSCVRRSGRISICLWATTSAGKPEEETTNRSAHQ